MILGQQAQDVLLREARSAPVIEDEQSERAARPCEPQRKSSRFGDVINPQSESVEGLLPLQPEPPAEGQGHAGTDLRTESHLELQRTPPRHQVSHEHAAHSVSMSRSRSARRHFPVETLLCRPAPEMWTSRFSTRRISPGVVSTLVPPIGPSQRSAANLSARACRRPMRWSFVARACVHACDAGRHNRRDRATARAPQPPTSESVFAAMTKSLRWSPWTLWVHQVAVTRPHSVSRAG